MTTSERNKFILESSAMADDEALEALKARDEAQERLDRANARKHAYAILKQEYGLTEETTVESSPTEGSAYVPPRQRLTIRTPVPPSMPLNKAEFVRGAIESAGTEGTTPAEIKAAAIKAGIKAYAGYPYTVIHRLKGQTKVEENAKGRLVLTKP